MDLPVKTLRDVVERASTKPGQLNWAGLTGALDIIFEGWLKSIGVDIKKVFYRNPVLTMDGLVGLFGPPTMPKDLRERIAADIRTVMDADPLIKDRLFTTAQVPNPGGPAEFAKSIDEQRAVLTKAAKDLGITPK
jgi:hypothetical protein